MKRYNNDSSPYQKPIENNYNSYTPTQIRTDNISRQPPINHISEKAPIQNKPNIQNLNLNSLKDPSYNLDNDMG